MLSVLVWAILPTMPPVTSTTSTEASSNSSTKGQRPRNDVPFPRQEASRRRWVYLVPFPRWEAFRHRCAGALLLLVTDAKSEGLVEAPRNHQAYMWQSLYEHNCLLPSISSIHISVQSFKALQYPPPDNSSESVAFH
ncbi:hypothetical protein E2C01_023733 [Portunus trituberculatus]|uniref:Secreted protein n=1 Tax=Portunus trituberculatus TaxID=210409 RepID=A0A5B7EAT9_PORTR|nr:hypothetical protein [Portunus trituberculatus]